MAGSSDCAVADLGGRRPLCRGGRGESRSRCDGGTIALPTSALVVYLCLTLGFFHLFWGGALRLAPIVHRDQVTVLAIETIRKPYKAGIVHWMFAEVSPWQGVDGPQRLQILDRDWMDRLEIGQPIELGWASVWKVRVIKIIEAMDAPEPSIVALWSVRQRSVSRALLTW